LCAAGDETPAPSNAWVWQADHEPTRFGKTARGPEAVVAGGGIDGDRCPLRMGDAGAARTGLRRRSRPGPATPVTLGEKIFADPSLSASGAMACASCHDPATRTFLNTLTDGYQLSPQSRRREALARADAAYSSWFTFTNPELPHVCRTDAALPNPLPAPIAACFRDGRGTDLAGCISR
jgi:cytochrome c peroxidase